jgi:hypothetical protein
VHRIRWDKPSAEADRIEALETLLREHFDARGTHAT